MASSWFLFTQPTELFNIYFVLAVGDYYYCFTYIDVGCNVIVSDGGVFQHCSLCTALENGLLPEGYRLVGDDEFQSHLIVSLYSTHTRGRFFLSTLQ